jgi:FkbM family methyltransferase
MISIWRKLNSVAKHLLPEALKSRLRGRFYGYRPARVAIPHAVVAEGNAWVVSIEGIRPLRVDETVRAQLEFHLENNGEAIEEFHGFLKFAREQGGQLLDVGANAGMFSLAFCAAREGNRAIAVEPERALSASIAPSAARCGLDHRIQSIHAFIGDAPGTVTGGTDAQNFFSVGPRFGSETIEQVTVDDLLAARGLTVTAIKIDVDGAELEVVRGAARTLRGQRPTVFLELHHGLLEASGKKPSDVVQAFVELGYRFETPLGAPLSARALADPRAALVRAVAMPA